MRKLIIMLPEEASTDFDIAAVIHLTPTTEEGYLAALAARETLSRGFALLETLIPNERADNWPSDGSEKLAKLFSQMINANAVLGKFLEPGCAIHNPGRKGRVQ